MPSQLHSRKRHVSGDGNDEESGELPSSQGGGSNTHSTEEVNKLLKRKRSSFFGPVSELRYALVAIIIFLSGGLFMGYFLSHHQRRKVILHIMKNPWAHGGAVLRGRAGFRHHFYSGSPRFVSVVMPSVVNPTNRHQRLRSIQDTWGPYARAIYVVHNVSEFPEAAHAVISDTSSPEDPYAFPQLLDIPSDIGVGDGVARLYHTIRNIHQKVNPDFAFFVNDHTFVIPDHLCRYLQHRTPDENMYEGHALKNKDHGVFNSGAAGYLLSRKTMQELLKKWNDEDPECWKDPKSAAPYLQSNPALLLVKCLESMGIPAVDTRSKKKWHRFHAYPVTREVSGQVDEWYTNYHNGMSAFEGFDATYDKLLSGEDCCSRSTISFHYVESLEARALFSVREAILNNPHMSDHELKSVILTEWPQKPKDIGAYSRAMPDTSDEAGWREILAVLRKISTRETQHDC